MTTRTRKSPPSRARAAEPFPRGVACSGTGRAFLRDPDGRLVAIDLATGAILWRSRGAFRPLFACDDLLIAATATASHALVIMRLDPRDGREIWAATPIPLPPWAPRDLETGPDFAMSADVVGDVLRLHWTAGAAYRGGAAPSRSVEHAARRHAEGDARVDLRTGAAREGSTGGTPPAPPPPSNASPAPDVVEQRDLVGRRFELTRQRGAAGTLRTTVRAVDPAAGHTSWETVLDERPATGPRPLRK